MVNDIVHEICKEPMWSFSQLIDLEDGGCMEIDLDCIIHSEKIDDKLMLVVTPLDSTMFDKFDGEKIKTVIKQEIWDKFNIVPIVTIFQQDHGFF